MNRRAFIGFLVAAPVSAALPWEKIAGALQKFAPGISADIKSALTLDEIISTTLRSYYPELVENISNNNVLLKKLMEADRRKRPKIRARKWSGTTTEIRFFPRKKTMEDKN